MRTSSLITPVLIAGSLVLFIGFSIRASFGLFQLPLANEFDWLRVEFSLAIAIQNLAWGVGQPIFSVIAEKYGDRLAVLGGALCYALGLLLSAYAITPSQHQWLEIIVGFGIAGTGFGVILAVVGRATPEKHRSMALGITTAAGSAGQIAGPPFTQMLLNQWPWQTVFMILAGVVLITIALLPFIKADKFPLPKVSDEGMWTVLKSALKDPSYLCIFVGFFSCGYQLAFITAHFPAFITESCSAILPDSMIQSFGVSTSAGLGAIAISLVGAANIVGTVLAGWLGNRYSKKYLLTGVYTLRTFVAAAFILSPITPESVVIFSIAMGSLWLATVPLTSGLVAQMYGLRYMGTLYGLVFFSHQLGGFLGVWLGGVMYDIHGSYTLVWWVGIGFGALSAVIHLPVDERPWQNRKLAVT